MEARVVNAPPSAEKWSPPSNASDIVKSVHAMLHPHNIVLVGATDKPGNYAERIWNNLVKYQFKGKLFPYPAAIEEKAAMSALMLIYVLLCVRSFITARRTRV